MAAEYSIGAQSLPCTTCYIATDHLDSTRMVTDQNANVVGRHDYLPFGEEIAANTGGRNGLFGTQDFRNSAAKSAIRNRGWITSGRDTTAALWAGLRENSGRSTHFPFPFVNA